MKIIDRFPLLALVVLTAALCWTACKKEDSGKTRAEKLTTPTCWQPTLIGTKLPLVGWQDVQVEKCEQDDCWKFTTAGSLDINRDTSLCNPSDNQTYTGTWEFNADSTQLTLDSGSGSTTTYDINELTDSKLQIKATISTVETRWTFKAKN